MSELSITLIKLASYTNSTCHFVINCGTCMFSFFYENILNHLGYINVHLFHIGVHNAIPSNRGKMILQSFGTRWAHEPESWKLSNLCGSSIKTFFISTFNLVITATFHVVLRYSIDAHVPAQRADTKWSAPLFSKKKLVSFKQMHRKEWYDTLVI